MKKQTILKLLAEEMNFDETSLDDLFYELKYRKDERDIYAIVDYETMDSEIFGDLAKDLSKVAETCNCGLVIGFKNN